MANDLLLRKESQTPRRPRKKDFRHQYLFESYGVKIRVTSNEAEAIEEVKNLTELVFSNCLREIEEIAADHHFLLVRNLSQKDSLYKNGEKIISRLARQYLIESLVSQIRLTIAEFARERVFVHAGVVGWKNRAILIPAPSFRGKTALTVALVKRGAIYYSDEYAVLDKDGFVHPFAKPLSVRGEIDEFTQVEYAVEKLGGTAGTQKIPVGMVLVTQYKPNGKWNPKKLSSANGIIELIKNAVPIRNNPKFSLEVFGQIAKNAIFIKSRRGDVSESADLILRFFENNCCKS